MLGTILNTRVGFKDFACFLFALLTVIPVFAENGVMKLLALALGAGLLIVMLKDRFLPSAYSVICAFYLAVFLYKGFGNFDMESYLSLAAGVFKVLVFVFILEWRLKDGLSVFMPLFGFVMTALVFLDALTVLLFPDGLYRDGFGIARWILGSKNNRLYWYVIDIALIAWNSRGKGKACLPVVAAFLVFLEASMLASESSTSAVALLVGIAGGILAIALNKGGRGAPISSYLVVFSVYLVLNVLILGGSTGFLRDFVSGYLGKDLTFSDRTVIWGEVLKFIQLKPEFGWGYLGTEATSQLLGRIDFVNAHNQILDSLLIGGVFLLALFIATQLLLAFNAAKSDDGSVRLLVCCCGGSLLVQMLFEQTLTLLPVWILFALLNGFCLASRSSHGRGLA